MISQNDFAIPQQPIPQQPIPQQPIPQQINQGDLDQFKSQLKQWLDIEKQISELSKQIKELKKTKKILEPQITQFMVQYNIKDVNTENGPVKCNQRNTKKPLNKTIIRNSLSRLISDSIVIDQAMTLMDQRETVSTYKLCGPKLS